MPKIDDHFGNDTVTVTGPSTSPVRVVVGAGASKALITTDSFGALQIEEAGLLLASPV
mgnify:CR=1 FL=1